MSAEWHAAYPADADGAGFRHSGPLESCDEPECSLDLVDSSHETCRDTLREGMAKQGVEVTVSTAPPIVQTAYDQAPFTCPHGARFYLAPTSEQIAEWRREGVQ